MRVFVWRENDVLRSYRLNAAGFADCSTQSPAPTTSHRCASSAQSRDFVDQHPGAFLALSASGSDANSAIVWAAAYRIMRGPGRLMAFAAEPASASASELPKLWDSEECEEDAIEVGAEFVPPTVANGKVFLATGTNQVDVFGLMADKRCTQVVRPEAIGPILQ